MAAANESQGLKIAEAAFVTLTVVLAVTTYFAYSGYSEASVKLADAEAKVRNAVNEVQKKSQEYDLLKQRVGYALIENAQHLLGAIKKDNDRLAEQLKGDQ